MKYPEMKIPTLGESEEEKSYGSPQMCSLHGNSRGPELQESVTGCKPAGRGINLNGITPLLLFLLLLLLHLLFHLPLFHSLTLLSLLACFFSTVV